jgi:hypothetical protein
LFERRAERRLRAADLDGGPAALAALDEAHAHAAAHVGFHRSARETSNERVPTFDEPRPRDGRDAVVGQSTRQQRLDHAAGRLRAAEPGGKHPRIVHDEKRARRQVRRQIGERRVLAVARRPVQDEQSRGVTGLDGAHRDLLGRQPIVELISLQTARLGRILRG